MKQKKTTTSTQTTTPTARPELQYALDQNRSLFELLQGREAAPFQTYAGFAPETVQGLDLTAARALAGSPVVGAARGAVGGIAANGPFGAAAPSVYGIASGASGNPYIDAFGTPGAGAGALGTIAAGVDNPAIGFLQRTAAGDFLDFSNNPYFQRGVGAINDSVGSIFERAGRTGSGANQSSVARGVGDLAAGVYNQERGNQLAAQQALGNLYQSGLNTRLSAAGALAGDELARLSNQATLSNADIANQLSAAGLLNAGAGTQLSAAGLAPQLANQDYIDLQNLLNVGAQRQQQEQAQIADQLYRYNFPYENAIQATNLLNIGSASLGPLLGSTTSGKSTETTSGGLGGAILGGLLTAGSLFAGGGAGGLGGLFGGAARGAPSAAPQLAGTLPAFSQGGFNMGGVPFPGYGG